MRYGIIIKCDISPWDIGKVIEIENETKDTYILSEKYTAENSLFSLIKKDCVKLIRKDIYDLLLPRNMYLNPELYMTREV